MGFCVITMHHMVLSVGPGWLRYARTYIYDTNSWIFFCTLCIGIYLGLYLPKGVEAVTLT